ncbi:damage-inducible protein DinI [Erwinia sp. OLTSP20]|uniref:DinI-like family protein n=1 Tax=unclassified Erwinia TaxID=2622719 RepID=UPI000C17A56C|nr:MULTISPECIES: DinI-like family protein [unclassified Erwinia]PIJ49459.1 damage-inducible protein DinI [Erwinia sp. OAMSP11]PIJ68989.1 damage-inducible protein DinI [Erwinia sp. OLSSP12]PIJ80989.1 damage-inducible protein DinI [Erwinia sp. OLMTSP26]PIJ83392.1 damage-inducible protein DinI [Erwinia sp. OLMDSP33]PIJ84305.1 damage-inducible protein DinI [Erwinia sp. OLCASP19]
MRVEISIAKEKYGKLPKTAPSALQEEMTKRLSKQYLDIEVIVKPAGSDGLSVFRAADKDETKKNVEKMLQEVWESADDWFF